MQQDAEQMLPDRMRFAMERCAVEQFGGGQIPGTMPLGSGLEQFQRGFGAAHVKRWPARAALV
jgi:hypothetical protein